ncbi:MAG TPA: PEP/pyruvate-binding domain-containing protein [Labilithrix sp.]|nr:PEP/pyruvate-binding domain-containing protein [Labilithrix sp.]
MLARVGLLLLVSSAIATSSLVAGCSAEDESGTAESDVSASPFWKNTIAFPNEPFAVQPGMSEPRWVKFTILVSDPTKVYFQDSNKYAFHYDFAKNHLPGFAQMKHDEFARVTLEAAGQKLITGVVLMPPRIDTMEVGIQLIRDDEYTKEEVKKIHDLVKSKITVEAGRSVRPFYMPTFAQSVAAQRDKGWLEANGVFIGSPDRWLVGDACYATGWAFGKAKYIAGADIKKAYLEGRLKTDDILVTDGVPAEVPYVAGIVSLSPSTPSSHVAILSKTWGIPFVFPNEQAARERIRGLDGQEIALRTTAPASGDETCRLDVIEPRGTIDAQTRADLAALRKPPAVVVPVKTPLGALTKAAVQLTPADVKYFGGKASNFGTLRRTIPASSPNALGISFDLWDAFLAQTLPTGKTLKEEIDARLGGLSFPPDMVALETKLEEIRALVQDTAKLPDAQRTKLFAELQAFGFDPKIKLRFRSSTNVEDGAVLSGAGLYDSYSGCLADDLDADSAGPSACDSAEPKEKGAERAVKKVFASFFNTNAVLERLKYGIKEADVGMALAAHYSFPDEREAANGVATVRLTPWSTEVSLVTQLGAESVTNPTGGALPETVTATVFGEDYVALEPGQGSTRVPLGAKIMTWESDYVALTKLIVKASQAFKLDQAFAGDELAIDIEYKKDTDGSLVLKQIRQIPERSRVPSVVPVLLDEPGSTLCTHQGEYGSVLANHRLKSRGPFGTRNTSLSDQAISQPIVSTLDFELAQDGAVVRKNGAPASFAGATHAIEGDSLRDGWSSPMGTIGLTSVGTRLVAPADVPLVLARDMRWSLSAKYTTPRPVVGWDGTLESVDHEDVLLEPCATDADVEAAVQTVQANGPNGLKVKTQFQYRKAETDYDKTAILGKWVSTEITGLTSRPILLKGWFSQSFRPAHHNFDESFVFEPGLEENLPPSIAQELVAKDIQAILMHQASHFGEANAKFHVLRKSTQKIEPL